MRMPVISRQRPQKAYRSLYGAQRTGLMDFSRQPLFAMISQRLGWLTERQRVLAENVANDDTPDYKAKDLKNISFEQMVRGASPMMSMARTSGKHLDTSGMHGSASGGQAKADKP